MKCPLCQQELMSTGLSVNTIGPTNSERVEEFMCRTRIKFDGKASLPHYEDREGKVYWYIPPYQIISSKDKTIVNKLDESNVGFSSRFTQPDFKHVFTVEEAIKPDNPEKLIKRINLLTLFS